MKDFPVSLIFIGCRSPLENLVGDKLIGPRVDIKNLDDLFVPANPFSAHPGLYLNTNDIKC